MRTNSLLSTKTGYRPLRYIAKSTSTGDMSHSHSKCPPLIAALWSIRTETNSTRLCSRQRVQSCLSLQDRLRWNPTMKRFLYATGV